MASVSCTSSSACQLVALGSLLFSLLMTGCSGSGGGGGTARDDNLSIARAVVEFPPDTGEAFIALANYDLAEIGYRQQEFFLSGTASAFRNLGELGVGGLWQVEPAETADYRTRMVVLRPIDPARFSGIVVVEMLPIHGHTHGAPIWVSGHTGIAAAGHAWVGVTAKYGNVEGKQDRPRLHLKAANPARYGTLSHPGDSFAYDILSQAAEVIRNPGAVEVLDGLLVRAVVAAGSGWELKTYINAVHPLYRPFAGYLLTDSAGGAPLAETPQQRITTPERVRVRVDLDVPVLTLQYEGERYLDFYWDSQEDGGLFRIWEIPGMSVLNQYTDRLGLDDDGSDPEFFVLRTGDYGCDAPQHTAAAAWIYNAALSALATWAADGVPAPRAERLELSDDGQSVPVDDNGFARGGVRHPWVEAPAAALRAVMSGSRGGCWLLGETVVYTADHMASLYVDKTGYLQQVREAVDSAVEQGFLLPVDGDRFLQAASLQWDRLDPASD